MELDKNKTPYNKSRSCVAESTNNTTTTYSSIDTVRIPDKNKTPYNESSSRIAESTNNMTTNYSSNDTVRIQVVETIPSFLEVSQLSLKSSVDA